MLEGRIEPGRVFDRYDCRVKPTAADGAAKARILYVTCDEYAERWDEIAAVFSKQAVGQCSGMMLL